MSCGIGIIHGKALKQKLKTKSTTQLEVVAVSEYVLYKIHMIIIIGDTAVHYKKRFLSRQRK